MHSLNMHTVFDLYTQLIHGVFRHQLSQGAKVDVGARFDNGSGHFLMAGAPFHRERNPLHDFIEVFGVAHVIEEMMSRHFFESKFQLFDRGFGYDGAMLGLVDKPGWFFDGALRSEEHTSELQSRPH